MEPAVTYQREQRIGIITLNQPDRRNRMSPDQLDAFSEVIGLASADRDARAIVIRGTGSCFSAGADLGGAVQRGDDHRLAHERSYAMYEPFLSVLDIEVPVIGCLNGHAVGGGFGLALLCDVRIGNRDAKYGANFTRIGLHPGLAISYLLPRLIGISQAAEMLFTGKLIRGSDAERMGLFSRALPVDEVEPASFELAEQIAHCAPNAVRMTKRSLYQGLGLRVRDAARFESFAQAITVDSDEFREGRAAFLEKREPEFD